MANTTAEKPATKSKRTTKPRQGLNPVLPEGARVPTTGQVVSLDLANRQDVIEVEPVKGLHLLQKGDKSAIPPSLQRFPLAVSKTGAWTGRLQNIGDYCLATLGKAFNQRQADAIRNTTGRVVQVVSDKEKKEISAKLDKLRGEFFSEAKTLVAALHSREDVTVMAVAIRPNAKGFGITTRAQLNTNRETEADVLRRKLAEAEATIKALQPHVPKNIMAKAEKKAHDAIEAEVKVTQEPLTQAGPTATTPPVTPVEGKDGAKPEETK